MISRLARIAILISVATGLTGSAFAQQASTAAPDETPWSGSVSGAWYHLRDDTDYVQPTIKADRDWLHLETRFAYEDRDSLSFFAGINFEFTKGSDVKLAVTPMLGGVAGDLNGIVPAVELDLNVWRVEAYGEAEYVFDLQDSSSKFFYMWSEVSVWPTDWLRGGIVTQRTRVYRSERDIQRGFLAGVSLSKVDATFYLFNPGSDDRVAVFSIGWSF
jgi:hypothetical protein